MHVDQCICQIYKTYIYLYTIVLYLIYAFLVPMTYNVVVFHVRMGDFVFCVIFCGCCFRILLHAIINM